MKLLYPVSGSDPKHYSDEHLAVKIARYSPCTRCPPEHPCYGLHPPAGARVITDSEFNEETELINLTSDVFDEEPDAEFLQVCECGHTATEHGADQAVLGSVEFFRKGRAAIRMDEYAMAAGAILDFFYSDPDIESLRRQLLWTGSPPPELEPEPDLEAGDVPPSPEKRPLSSSSSSLSEAFEPAADEPPPKKQRRSYSFSSSLSDTDSSSADEEKPLSAQRPQKSAPSRTGKNGKTKSGVNGRRTTGGKSASSMKSKAHTAPISMAPPTEQERAEMTVPANIPNGHDVKVEDRMDEGQLNRLATGVTVDTGGGTTANPSLKPEKPSAEELRKGIIRIVPVENDGQPRSLVILTGLKTLFQKQLPKMPREYIARLVYDVNSKCLAIIKRGYKVVGGICYRPFPHRGFAEITFFATASVDQVKGYGGMLMDHFKAHIRKTYPNMDHFLTYADNYAVGYFRKQGFSKDITLDRSVWAGYIKDYEGGTIMQCTMLPKIDYLQMRDILAKQREAILDKIREKSRSHIVYPGLDWWKRGNQGEIDPKDVPGLRESGWNPSMLELTKRPNGKSAEHSAMEKLLSDLQGHPLAWAFLQPVNAEEVPDYYEVIKKPMDFGTMEHKLDTNQYATLDDFVKDAKLVFDNCRTYNAEGSLYHKNATKLEKFMKEQLTKLKLKKE
ncbi:Bromodomain-containing protein [Panus rudis PR-1116 ss-1]|nr:Bromodomain-containing protein [Panus rudis PR-1116 ss-1]